MLKKLILLFVIGSYSSFHAQDKIDQAIQTLEEKYPQEKVHLLLNKNSFIAGENLWFKSFVFNGYSPSGISTNLFVELYDNNKKLIDKKLVPLLNGEGNGSFALPESLKEDVYYIRAYTTWMTNFSEDFQFVKPILVYNPSSPDKLVKDTVSAWSATVHPESGTFIGGINTRFAVRLHSKGVTPSNWNGYVIDTEKPDVKIVTFKGYDENASTFRITPQNGKKYQLIVEDNKGTKHSTDLPPVSSSGINLQIENTTNSIKYTLKSKNLPDPSAHYKVLGTVNNQLAFTTSINSISDKKIYSIPTVNLPNGILQITVFDDKENLIVQRLCFIKPDLLNIKQPEVQNLSLNTSPRASNTFNVPQNGEQLNTIMILDGDSQSTEEEDSLLGSLWLTGDISSDISSPAQYFVKNHNSEALDAILISEKWKRFDWKSAVSGNFPMIKNTPESYISYKGKVTIQGKPAPDADLNLIFNAQNNGVKTYQIKTDANGFFTLAGLIFEGPLKFSYQLNDKTIPKEQVQVIFQPNYAFVPYKGNLSFSKYTLSKRSSEDTLPPEIVRYVETKKAQKTINEKITDIEEVKIKGHKKNLTRKLNDELSSSLFKSNDEIVFDFVNDHNQGQQGATNIIQWLQGKVAGLQVRYTNGNYEPIFRGTPINVYIDEMSIQPEIRFRRFQYQTLPW